MPVTRKIPTLMTDKGGAVFEALKVPAIQSRNKRFGQVKVEEVLEGIEEVAQLVAKTGANGGRGLRKPQMDAGGNSGPRDGRAGKWKRVRKEGEEEDKDRGDTERMLSKAVMREFRVIYEQTKNERNADRVLSAYQGLAAKALVGTMIFGDKTEVRQAAKEILDRVLGRSVERKMTLALNVDGMSLTEVDNELKRLASGHAGGQEAAIIEATFTEGENSSGDAGGSVSTEQGAESISGESNEDKGTDLREQVGKMS